MTQGRLIAVVGPSGVGKDSVMAGIHAACPGINLVRRVITRKAEPCGEDHETVTVARFDEMARNGSFAVHWRAHGLSYGIPADVQEHLSRGKDCLANLSRKALEEAAATFPRLLVLNITAAPDTLARRLAGRGRETQGQIEKRLAQAAKPLPEGLEILHLSNDGLLAETVTRALTLLQPASL